MKKRSLISTSLVIAILISLFSGFATVASATTVRNLSAENFVVESKTPQELGHWEGNYTATVTNGENNSRIIACTQSRTDTHLSLSIPEYAVNNNSSANPYILHLSYRIQNDRTNPAYITHTMRYYNSSNKKDSYNDIFVTETSQFTMNQDTSKNITTFYTSTYNYLDPYDYKVDLYENLKTGAYQIYLNGVKWISAYDYSTAKNLFGSDSYKIHEYRIRVTGKPNSSWAFKLVNPCYEIYSQDVLMDDVIAATAAGMSNYVNLTASPASQQTTNMGSNNVTQTNSGHIPYTVSGSEAMTNSKYWVAWWDGTKNTNGTHQPFLGSRATSDKAWLHIGYNISNGSNIALKMNVRYYTESSTAVLENVVPAYSGGSSYRADLFYDTSENIMYIYYNNVYSGQNDISTWFQKASTQQMAHWRIGNSLSGSYSFTISNAVFEYYPEGATPGDMLIGYDARTKTTYDYIYEISGIQSGTNVIGKMDGLCNITGNNSSGYTLTPTSINATNGGFARYYLNYTVNTGIFQSTDDKVLVYTAYYTPSVVSANSMHQIGIRGNDGYYWFLKAEGGKFYDNTGNFLKPYSTSGSYRIDFIMNNKDYKYYWLLDGVCFDSGSLYSDRRPIWQITYTMRNTSDRMVLKNISATLCKNNYSLLAKTKPLLSTSWVYADTVSYSVAGSTANIQTSYIANTTNPANANTKVLYAVYNNAGQLLHYQTAGSSSNVNGSNLTTAVTIP